MRACVYSGTGALAVAQRDRPRLGPLDLLVEVKACGVCGTDLHIFEGEFPATPGIALGHEYAGIVAETGSAVTGFARGDHVAVDPNITCGTCPACRRGDVHLCDYLQALGVTRDGGFAEYSVVPVSQAYPVPKSVSFDACAFAEPLACCLHGVDLAAIQPGDRVLVIGAGSIGLLMLQLVRLSGAAVVVVAEPIGSKRTIAVALGADQALDPEAGSIAEACRDLAPGGFDAVLECVGRPATAAQALTLARRGGRIVWFGVNPPGATIPIEPYLVYRNELTIRAAFINPHTFGRAVALLGAGRVQTAPLVSHHVGLAAVTDGLGSMKTGRAVKVLVLPDQR